MNIFTSTFQQSMPQKIGFDDILSTLHDKSFIRINTLPANEQSYMIKGTLSSTLEEDKINEIMGNINTQHEYTVIIYGKNSVDDTLELKYTQMIGLGFKNVFIYYGGLFEWVMLQELYGKNVFPSEGTCNDLLRYKHTKKLTSHSSVARIEW